MGISETIIKNKKYFLILIAAILIFISFDNLTNYILGTIIFLAGMIYGYTMKEQKEIVQDLHDHPNYESPNNKEYY